MKRMLLLSMVFSLFSINVSAQIHSTYLGGLWNNPNTWVGGNIPGGGDDVVIEGPVIQGSANGYDILTEYCNNILITSNGSIANADYGGGTGIFPLVVNGNVVNNGIVCDGPSDLLKIYISGDLENNNVWMPYETEFQTSNNHNLSLAPGKSFGSRLRNNGSPSFTALTDMYFTCDYTVEGYLFRDHFFLNGQSLNLGDHSIELHQNCLINSGSLIGDFEILGTFTVGWADGYDIRDTLVFVGDIIVTDTLTGNSYGGGYGIYKLKVIGNLTNNGVVKDDYDLDNPLNNDDLNILITGNIINNGSWTCNFVNFIGTETQYIFQNSGNQFDSYFKDLNVDSKVQAQSDITITKDYDLNGAALDMGGHTLLINGWLYNGYLDNAILNNGYLQNLTTLSNLNIKGKVTIDDGNIFQGPVIITDTLQNNNYGGGSYQYILQVDNDIINNGLIRDYNPVDDRLIVKTKGHITNNNLWTNFKTVFIGSTEQQITLAPGKVFETWFEDVDSTSNIKALTDIITTESIYLGRATFDMNSHHLKLNPGKAIHNGYLKNSKLKNGILSYLTLLDSIQINGTVEISDFVDAIANITVKDTLSATSNGGGTATYAFKVFGDIENQGFVGSLYDDLLIIKIRGNIVNKGVWTAHQNYQLFYPNHSLNTVSCLNTGFSNWLFNGSNISGNGSTAFEITSGGGIQTVTPNQSYDLSIQFAYSGGDTTATLSINSTEIGSLSTIYLIGHNYNITVEVEENSDFSTPEQFVLYQNYPNPFNPTTKISWQSPVSGWQTLKVYDVLGNEITTLVDEEKPAGSYEVEFNANNFSSGVFFYQLKSGNYIETKKMTLLK